MIYLSQLVLNPRSRQVQSELRNPYEMHRTLSKAFGDDADRQSEARCLFRVEEIGDGLAVRALVQSRVRPAWDQLTASPDYLAASVQIKDFNPQVTAGQHLSFRLRANPTVRRNGIRLGLYQEQERLAWLDRKASLSGFEVCRAIIKSDMKQECRVKDANNLVFSAVEFDGILRVTDTTVLVSALEAGIGTGKGFGFGLLSLARVKA